VLAGIAIHCLQLDSLSAAAAHMGVDAAVLQMDVEQYNAAAVANKDVMGKQYFPTTIDAAGVVWVGQITPVVHYTMGGLKINDRAQVGSHLSITDGNCVAVLLTQRHRICIPQPLTSCQVRIVLCAGLLLYQG
jgi:succinate dehydrogenase/fumarate reductase flavoprotein subunit